MTYDEIYKGLLTGSLSCEDASKEMKSKEIQKQISLYVNKGRINGLIPYFESDLQNIYMIINICQFIYNSSGCETGVSDYDYDILYSIMIENGGQDIISTPITPDAVHEVVHHKYPHMRGTLSKTYYLEKSEQRRNKSRRYLDEWKESMERIIFDKTGRHVDLDEEDIYVFPKYDGVSVVFEMNENGVAERALTRGYTTNNEAENVIHVFKDMKRRPKEYHEYDGPYALKTEVMMSEDNFEKFNRKFGTTYKNSRSIVSAILNTKEYNKEYSKYLTVVPLRVGAEDGSQTLAMETYKYPYLCCKLKDREAIRKFADKHYFVKGLRCDGAVIYLCNKELQGILGRKDNKNMWEVAYKFTEEVGFTTVQDVMFNVGLFGHLAPVAYVKPIKLKHNKIKQVSLGSFGRFKDLELRRGDRVKILYDIIPYLSFDDECEHSMEDIVEVPRFCPECGEDLLISDSGDDAMCVNPKCPCRKKGKILNYLFKMDIDGISYGVIDKLYDAGIVKSIPDIYKIEERGKVIYKLDGVGVKKWTAWVDSINQHRLCPDYKFLGSIGIDGIGVETFKTVCKDFDVNMLLECAESEDWYALTTLTGIGEKKSKAILQGIYDNRKLINKLQEELYIIDTLGSSPDGRYTVYFTKFRDPGAKAFIEENHGELVDNFNNQVTFLFTKDGQTSSKVEKAEKAGIPVVDVGDMKKVITKFMELKGDDVNNDPEVNHKLAAQAMKELGM